MTEDPYLRGAAVILLFASGLMCGRALFSPKVQRHQRPMMALTMASMGVLQAKDLLAVPSTGRFWLLALAGAMLVGGVVWSAFSRPSPDAG